MPYQAFGTLDGYLVLAVGNDSQFARLCQVLHLEHLAADDKFKTNAARVRNRQELIQTLSDLLKQKRTSEWVDIIPAEEVPVCPVNSISQVFNDPQVLHRQMVQEVDHPTAGKIKLAGFPIKLSESPAEVRLPPPVLGQHTAEILSKYLGYPEQQILELERAAVIDCWQNKYQ